MRGDVGPLGTGSDFSWHAQRLRRLATRSSTRSVLIRLAVSTWTTTTARARTASRWTWARVADRGLRLELLSAGLAAAVGAVAGSCPRGPGQEGAADPAKLSNPWRRSSACRSSSTTTRTSDRLRTGRSGPSMSSRSIPIEMNEDWNVISRTILPVVYAGRHRARRGTSSASATWCRACSFAEGADIRGMDLGRRSGVPPAHRHDDLLTADQFGAGPTAVALKQENGWTYGAARVITSGPSPARRRAVTSTRPPAALSFLHDPDHLDLLPEHREHLRLGELTSCPCPSTPWLPR